MYDLRSFWFVRLSLCFPVHNYLDGARSMVSPFEFGPNQFKSQTNLNFNEMKTTKITKLEREKQTYQQRGRPTIYKLICAIFKKKLNLKKKLKIKVVD